MTTRKLRSIVTGFRRGLLGNRSSDGMCYAVCLPLQAYLLFLGFESAMVGGSATVFPSENKFGATWQHYWLKLPDETIIDPTADQFGGPKVLIGEKPDHYVEEEVYDLEEKK